MLVGLDQVFDGRFAALRRRLRDARVGLLTHAAAIDRRGRPALVVLEELGAAPAVIFSPEHGLEAVAQAEEPVLEQPVPRRAPRRAPPPKRPERRRRGAPATPGDVAAGELAGHGEATPVTEPSPDDTAAPAAVEGASEAAAEAAAPAPDQPAEAPEEAEAGEPAPARMVSLYGATRESLVPRAEDLALIDVLVIDLCDVGSRYYTFVWTALIAARAAARAGVHVVILDRPNPISGDATLLEGAPQQAGFLSFVGLESVPIRHGRTLAELVLRFLEADGLPLGPEGAASVVPTRGWERLRTAAAWGRPFVPPSPNMPTAETALVYPGACLVEGTNLSEGRGTTVPFQTVGAPWLDGARLCAELMEHGVPGALVRPVSFRPTFEKHAGVVCRGVMLHVTTPALFRPVATYLQLIALARRQDAEAFRFRTEPYEFEATIPAFDLLTGSAAAREALLAGASPGEVAALVAPVDPALRAGVLEDEERVLRAMA